MDLHIFFQIFVYGKERQFFFLFVPDQNGVQIRGIAVGLAVIDRTFYQRVQYGSAAVGTGKSEGIKDRLSPGTGIRSHNRSDHIDQLCQAGDLDTVSMLQESNEKTADQKCILKIVDILQLMRCLAPFFQLFICFMRMIPDIPFIKGKIDLFLSAFLCFDTVQNGDNGRDKLIHSHTSCQEIRCVVGGI